MGFLAYVGSYFGISLVSGDESVLQKGEVLQSGIHVGMERKITTAFGGISLSIPDLRLLHFKASLISI